MAAMLLPFLPEIAIPVAHAEGTSITNYYMPVSGDGTFTFDYADYVSVSGTNQNMTVKSEETDIYVYGDYYKETHQYNPKVGEMYSGNYSMACKDKCLWSPKLSELPDWFVGQVMHDYGYAALYTGFMEMDNIYGYKPYGVTRVGEILGYDVYAANGEYFNHDMGTSGNLLEYAPASTDILAEDSEVSPMWALINTYRAVGKELYAFGVAKVPNSTTSGVLTAVCGAEKITDGQWDVNKSPVVSYLTGNIEANFTGADEPVVLVYSSRTDPDCYLRQARTDALEFDDTGAITMSCAEFVKLVADLMEAYGEPVITEMEQYMLLEAYGRKLPYDLFPAQLEAVKYLMVRGIIDSPDELASMTSEEGWNWNSPINFEQASTILMRVKDKGSRLTFKEFQLTTDLELLKKGYYPVEMTATDSNVYLDAEAIDWEDPAMATHYDYFVRRQDNRALFLSGDEYTADGQAPLETTPHVATADGHETRLAGSYYRGRTNDGWYWFQVPMGDDDVYLNSRHSETDSPAAYRLEVGSVKGGYYIVGNGTGDTDVVSVISQTPFDAAGADGSYVDSLRHEAAVQAPRQRTGYLASNPTDDKNKVTAWTVSISKNLVESLTWGADNKKWSEALFITAGTTNKYGVPGAQGVPVYVKLGAKEPVYTAQQGYVPCEVWYPREHENGNYYKLIVTAQEPITKEMAWSAVNLNGTVSGGLLDSKDGGASSARTVRAYCRYNEEYLVSTKYLMEMGAIANFTDLGDNKYHMSVRYTTPEYVTTSGPIDVDRYTDVYFNCAREDAQLCMFGTVATIYPAGTPLVNQMGDDIYVMASAVNGRLKNCAIEIPGDVGVALCVSPTPNMFYSGRVICGGRDDVFTYAQCTQGGVTCINATAQCPAANWVVVFDKRKGDSRPVMYTLYETGTKVTSNISTENKKQFMETFGIDFKSDSIYFVKEEGAPEGGILDNGDVVTWAGNNIICSGNGDVLIKLPTEQLAEVKTYADMYAPENLDDLPVVPVFRCTDFNYYSYLTNWYVGADTPKPVVVNYWYNDDSYHYDTSYGLYCREHTDPAGPDTSSSSIGIGDTKIENNSQLRVQPCGLPSLIAGCSLQLEEGVGNGMYVNDALTRLYVGCDALTTYYRPGELPFTPSLTYVMHYAGEVLLVQLYNGNLDLKNALAPIEVSGSDNLVSEEPNKITDWLAWLKEAKLEDAEDILTIAIIAVLQWLPRIFMFIFFLLMGLSMIAEVKPWVVFCDRIFDPYKFLTAGRMDVHTINIKKVVLCSMIALVLFGFFQNGLILDIIAWCARAVTGIINR